MTVHALRCLLPLSLLLFLSACTGDGDGTVDSLPASADVVLTDAPHEDLLYLRAELESVVLEREDGSLTSNLLGAPLQVDLLSLSGLFEWVASSGIGSGTYSAVRLGFDPGQFAGADNVGTPVIITPLSSLLRAAFELPFTVDPETYARFEVDFDLLSS